MQAPLRNTVEPEELTIRTVPDLAAAWRVLHALPAAKTAMRTGVGLSAGGTAMGSLFMIPSVRGVGPGPVTAGAAAGVRPSLVAGVAGGVVCVACAAFCLRQAAPRGRIGRAWPRRTRLNSRAR